MALWPWGKKTNDAVAVLTKEEAIHRAREHAQSGGGHFEEPYEVSLEGRTRQAPQGAGRQPVYIVTSVAYIPVSIIEVDAVSGEILKWQTFPR